MYEEVLNNTQHWLPFLHRENEGACQGITSINPSLRHLEIVALRTMEVTIYVNADERTVAVLVGTEFTCRCYR